MQAANHKHVAERPERLRRTWRQLSMLAGLATVSFFSRVVLAQMPLHEETVEEVLEDHLEKLSSPAFWFKIFLYIAVPALIFLVALILRRVASKRVTEADKLYSVRGFITRITLVIVVVYFVLVFSAGGTARSVVTIFGLLGAGVAVALQDIISSFVAWFFVIGARGFRIGDRIRIGEVKGDVVDVGMLRSTVVTVQEIAGSVEGQATGSLRVFPNNVIFKQTLENFTLGTEHVWHEIAYLVTYESDWRKAERIVLSAAEVIDPEAIAKEAHQKMMAMRRDFRVRVGALTPIVYVKAVDSGVLLTLRYLCDIRKVRGTADRITREVMKRFSDCDDVDFAYPTMRALRSRTSFPSSRSIPETVSSGGRRRNRRRIVKVFFVRVDSA